MKVAIYNQYTGAALAIVAGDNPNTIAGTLAVQSNFWGLVSRVLDGSPFEGEMTILNLPILPALDAMIVEAGMVPTPFDPDIHS